MYQGLNFFLYILGIQNTYKAENVYAHDLKKGTPGELTGIDIECCSSQLFIEVCNSLFQMGKTKILHSDILEHSLHFPTCFK